LLLGGSGAGKTTLINAVIGYEQADATILLNGADVYKDYESVKHKIGFVPQQNLIRGKDTVVDTVRDAAVLRLPKNISGKERRTKMTEVMDLLGLSAGRRGLISKKSGGQLRRICIALELVTDPELFVLDEPDSGLDGVISREIFSKLRQIADEDRIVMVVTHTPDRVIDLFDKVIVLAKDSGRVGRLAFYGSPKEARMFFGKESMEQIVMSVNSAEEGGEGRADEMIGKYAAYAAAEKGGRSE
jgi:ABC-type multidrug transport system ATPase subunit